MADVQKLNVNGTTYDISVPWGKVTDGSRNLPNGVNLLRGSYDESNKRSKILQYSTASKDGYKYYDDIYAYLYKDTIYHINAETDGTWSAHNTDGVDPSYKYCGLWLATRYTWAKHISIGVNSGNGTFTVSETGEYCIRTNSYSNGTVTIAPKIWNISITSGSGVSKDWMPCPLDLNYATQTWVNNKGYITGITKSMVTNALGYTPPTSDTNTTYSAGTGLSLSGTTFNVNYGTTAGTSCQGNDNRLSNARPASDVYSWAKAASKPTYTYSEVGAMPSKLADLYLDGDWSNDFGLHFREGGSSVYGFSLCYGSGDQFRLYTRNDSNNISVFNVGRGSTVMNFTSTPTVNDVSISLSTHTHDGRYYTKSEFDTKMNGKSNTGHTHTSFANDIAVTGVVDGTIFTSKTSSSASSNTTGYFRWGRFDEDTGGFKMQFGGDDCGLQIINKAWNKSLFTFQSTGNLTVTGKVSASSGFYQESDERLKTFHDPIKVDLEKLKTLRKNYFKFNDKDKLEIGVSAQEIQSLYPEIVSTNDEGYLSVAYDKLSVIALSAIDELDDKILELTNKISILENIVNKLIGEKGIN